MFTNQDPETLTPEEIVEALRAVRAKMGELTPLQTQQRKALVRQITSAAPILQHGINTIGVTEYVAKAVGAEAGEVRELAEEAYRWTAVEDELRAMLMGISGANVLRRHHVAIVAARAAGIAATLTRDPAHAVLVPHVLEIRRLRSYRRRKKAEPQE